MSRVNHKAPFDIPANDWLRCRLAAAAGDTSAQTAMSAIEAARMAALPMALRETAGRWWAEPLAEPPPVPADWRGEHLIRGRKANPETEGGNRFAARTITLRAKRAAAKGGA